jgi:hypothetical protein
LIHRSGAHVTPFESEVEVIAIRAFVLLEKVGPENKTMKPYTLPARF